MVNTSPISTLESIFAKPVKYTIMIMKIAHALLLVGSLGLAFFGIKYLFSNGHAPVAICILLIGLSFFLSFVNSIMNKNQDPDLVNTRSGPMYPARGGKKQKRQRAR